MFGKRAGAVGVLWLVLWVNSNGFAQNLSFDGTLFAFNQTGNLPYKRFQYNVFASFTSVFADNFHVTEFAGPCYLQTYLQPSVIYQLTPQINLSASITYNNQRGDPHGLWFYELRPFEQITYAIPVGLGNITNRLRLEHRFTEFANEDSPHTTQRLRYQLGFNHPIWDKPTTPYPDWFITAGNEFYFTLTNTPFRVRNAVYSENWAHINLGHRFSARNALEIGFMSQVVVRNRQHNFRELWLVSLVWVRNLTQ